MSSESKVTKVWRTIFYFILAGILEIGGGYLVWLWLREDYGFYIGLIGGLLLFLYVSVQTLQPTRFHRVYASYGGVFIALAMLWGWFLDGITPDRFDLLGVAIALVGVTIIFYYPRKEEEIC